MVKITNKSQEFSNLEVYNMTKSHKLNTLKNLEDGAKLDVAGFMEWEDTNEETGEVIEDYKEKHRYLYCDTFTKTQVAKDLGISRPTLNKKLETLFKIGLIKESQGWSKEKKKYVPVWIFPPFNIEDFIDAKTANFFTELALYKNQYSKKGTMHEKIIELLFDLKRYWYAVEKNKSFYITNLLKDLNLSDKAENRIRIFDYLLLL